MNAIPSSRRVGVIGTLTFLAAVGAPQAGTSQVLSLPLADAAADIDGTTIHYRIGGQGPGLLLIHGGGRSSHDWDLFLDVLGREFTVVLPELPGHGGSERLPGDFSMSRIASAMLMLLNELGIEEVRGIGHSLGAITLLHMASQAPTRMEAMVLVSGAHRLSPDARESLSNLTLEDLDAEQREYSRIHHPGGEPQVRAILRDVRSLGQNFADFDFSPEHLSAIPTRTLLVSGDRDPVMPVELAVEMYESMPNAALWVVPNQGHTSIWEEWGGSADAQSAFPITVRDFLQAEAGR